MGELISRTQTKTMFLIQTNEIQIAVKREAIEGVSELLTALRQPTAKRSLVLGCWRKINRCGQYKVVPRTNMGSPTSILAVHATADGIVKVDINSRMQQISSSGRHTVRTFRSVRTSGLFDQDGSETWKTTVADDVISGVAVY